jgi:hypothetical protein
VVSTPCGSKYPISAARIREWFVGFAGGFDIDEGRAGGGVGAILEDGVHGVEYLIKSSQGIDMEVESQEWGEGYRSGGRLIVGY